MTLANVKTFLEVSGADREASDIVQAAGVKMSDPREEQGYARYVWVLLNQRGIPGGLCAGTDHAGGCL